MHRIPRTLHDGSFVRTPFPTKILTAQEKARKAMEELLFYRAFIYCIHGRCREHALALTHRRICEKLQNFPILIAISDGDIYRWKAEYAMIYHLSKLYMAIIIIAVEWTLSPLHIVDVKENRKWTVFKHHFRLRYRRYRKTENTMTCYSSRAFII